MSVQPLITLIVASGRWSFEPRNWYWLMYRQTCKSYQWRRDRVGKREQLPLSLNLKLSKKKFFVWKLSSKSTKFGASLWEIWWQN